MTFHLTKTIALVGLMGAGKTAVGSLVAQKLGVLFRDSDQEIVKAANMQIDEIFERDGEPFFRARETQILARLLQGAPCLLSTGGGAYMRAENRKLISDKGIALWLRADLALLWSRVRTKDSRPLLRTDDPFQTLSEIYQKRTPIYAKAELVADAEADLTLEQMADKVVAVLLANDSSGVRKGPET